MYDEQEKIAVWHRDRHADNEDVGLVIKYTGSEPSCLITVAADGKITSAIGAVSGELSDTNFLEPGGTGGTIDPNAAAADSFGELERVINSLADYEAYLVDVRKADSSDNTLLAAGPSQAKLDSGLELKKDTAVALNISIAISGENFQYLEDGCRNELDYILSNDTFTGTNKIQIYDGETKVNEWDGAASGIDQELDNTKIHHGVLGKKLLLRMIGSSDCTGFLITNVKTTRTLPTHKYKSPWKQDI